MTVEYSKQFVKAAKKLTGKYKESLINLIIEVKKADSVYSVSDCIKLTGYQNIYRIKTNYHGFSQTRYLPLQKADLTQMKASEKDVIDRVIDQMSDWNASMISEYSHGDRP